MKVIRRKDAKALGLTYYFTGKPCIHGHVCKRIVDSYSCYECVKIRWRSDEKKKYSAKYREKNRVKIRANHKKWREANAEKIAQWNVEWRKNNPEKCAEMDRDWNRRNGARKVAHRAKRRARIRQRTPAWADQSAIDFFYECCPKDCHVDHIIPIKGKDISGFHIETNLQWLPATANLSKSNAWDG